MKILFINQADILSNNSVGITVKSLFGEEVLSQSLIFQIIDNKHLNIISHNESIALFQKYIFQYKKIINILIQYSPDIIYTTGNSVKTLSFLLFLKKKYKVPVLIHYYDNWREIGSSLVKNILLRKIEDKRYGALVVSKEMKLDYERKYKQKYTILMNNCARFSFSESKSNDIRNRKDKTIHFLYAGGLHLSRYKKLLDLSKILAKNNIDGIIDIYTFERDRKMYSEYFNDSKCRFFDCVSHDKIFEIYSMSDVVLYIESIFDNNPTYIKYSMSTKIPEYLAVGKPIICYSEPGTGSYSFFKRERVATLVHNEDDFIDFINKYINQDDSIVEMVERGLNVLDREFNPLLQKQQLFGILEKISGVAYE